MDFQTYLASIANMTAAQVEEQRSSLTAEIDTAESDRLDEINQALEALNTRSQALQAIETRRQDMRQVAGGAGNLLDTPPAGPEARRTAAAYLRTFRRENGGPGWPGLPMAWRFMTRFGARTIL